MYEDVKEDNLEISDKINISNNDLKMKISMPLHLETNIISNLSQLVNTGDAAETDVIVAETHEDSLDAKKSEKIEETKVKYYDLFNRTSSQKNNMEVNLDEDEENDLEQIRLKNIEKNKKLFEELFKDQSEFEFQPKKKEKQKRHYQNKENSQPIERRVSSRIRGERVKYDEYELDKLFEDEDKPIRHKKRFELVLSSGFKLGNRFPKLSAKRTPVPVLPVSEVTQEHINNISDRAFEKVYSKLGSSCHQCRQKTIDTKTFCRSGICTGVRGQFCGPCLDGRYGEKVSDALVDPTWSCPPCRGICNCSICLSRQGYAPTGILRPYALEKGYKSVKHYLEAIKKEIKEKDNNGIERNVKLLNRKSILNIEEFSEESSDEFFGFE